MSWYRNLWQRAVDKFLDYWLDVIVVGLATGIGFYIKDWLFITIPVWPVVILVMTIVIVILGVRIHNLSPKSFKPFSVVDVDLDAAWWIKRDPKHWIDWTIDHHPTQFTDGILDGPFCRRKKEAGGLCLGDFSRINDSSLSEQCRLCGRALFKDEDGEPKSVKISRSELKLVVIHALQREVRRGRSIRKNFSFGVIDLNN